MKMTMKLLGTTKPFKMLNATFIHKELPTCQNLTFKSDKYYECYARYLTANNYHISGGCKMGKGLSDPTAVLDSKLRYI